MNPKGTVELKNLGKDYVVGDQTLCVLEDIYLRIDAGSDVVITGPSGTGKSTLLHLIGSLEKPSRGQVFVDGQDLSPLHDAELAQFRSREVGFVFQDHHLLPQFSILQNVLLPSLADRARAVGAEDRARALLLGVGLEERLQHRPAQLSGGERQRAAIARALINEPSVLLCDEPTGNLDSSTAEVVADLLFALHKEGGGTMITVTHSGHLAQRFSRRLVMDGGSLQEDTKGSKGTGE